MKDFHVLLSCLFKISRNVGFIAITSYLLFKLYAKYYLDRFHLVGKVADLMIYPVVSCGALRVASAQCTPDDGLAAYGILDRALVVCRKNKYPNPMLAYGEYSLLNLRNLVQIKSEYTPDFVTLTDPKGITYTFDPSDVYNRPGRRVQLVCVKSIYSGNIVGQNLCSFFERYLKRKEEIAVIHRVKLLWDKLEGRTVLGKVILMNGESVIEAFHSSIASIENKTRASCAAFSPNIVIAGCRPFAENRWKTVSIGSQVYGTVLGTDVRVLHSKHEEFYRENRNVLDHAEAVEEYHYVHFKCGMNGCRAMGAHIKLDSAGEISVGDPVYAVYKRPSSIREGVQEFYHLLMSIFRATHYSRDGQSISRSLSFLRQSRKSLGKLPAK